MTYVAALVTVLLLVVVVMAKMNRCAFSSVSYSVPFESTLQSSSHQHWDATMTERAISCKVLFLSNQLRLILTVGNLKHSSAAPAYFSVVQKYSTRYQRTDNNKCHPSLL